ncbi:hypothetical protein M3Y98_01162200 [Aphelenchoides besseyi]|nr:hypothetical protein M3Y98_01162200 [Aphelenchoides besseyi]
MCKSILLPLVFICLIICVLGRPSTSEDVSDFENVTAVPLSLLTTTERPRFLSGALCIPCQVALELVDRLIGLEIFTPKSARHLCTTMTVC